MKYIFRDLFIYSTTYFRQTVIAAEIKGINNMDKFFLSWSFYCGERKTE